MIERKRSRSVFPSSQDASANQNRQDRPRRAKSVGSSMELASFPNSACKKVSARLASKSPVSTRPQLEGKTVRVRRARPHREARGSEFIAEKIALLSVPPLVISGKKGKPILPIEKGFVQLQKKSWAKRVQERLEEAKHQRMKTKTPRLLCPWQMKRKSGKSRHMEGEKKTKYYKLQANGEKKTSISSLPSMSICSSFSALPSQAYCKEPTQDRGCCEILIRAHEAREVLRVSK